MKPTWPYKTTPIAATVNGDVTSDGKVLLNFTRNSLTGANPYRMSVTAEADGPVVGAFLDPRGVVTGYLFYESPFLSGLRQGRVVGEILNVDLNEHTGEAFLGWKIGELRPKVLWSSMDSNGHAVSTARDLWGLHNSYEIDVAMYPGAAQKIYTQAQANGLQQTMLYPYNGVAFWESGNLVYSNIMAYKPGKGVYPFITFNGDPSKGAHGIGTDGVSLVWVQSSGKPPDESPYPINDVMVSPYTDDPAQLQPKRLRSFPTTNAVILPWVVGCGYAAYSHEPGKAIIVRLSDGVSWLLPEGGCVPPATTEWCWDEIHAITCDEVFLRAGNLDATIARVRLDALGPGLPPD